MQATRGGFGGTGGTHTLRRTFFMLTPIASGSNGVPSPMRSMSTCESDALSSYRTSGFSSMYVAMVVCFAGAGALAVACCESLVGVRVVEPDVGRALLVVCCSGVFLESGARVSMLCRRQGRGGDDFTGEKDAPPILRASLYTSHRAQRERQQPAGNFSVVIQRLPAQAPSSFPNKRSASLHSVQSVQLLPAQGRCPLRWRDPRHPTAGIPQRLPSLERRTGWIVAAGRRSGTRCRSGGWGSVRAGRLWPVALGLQRAGAAGMSRGPPHPPSGPGSVHGSVRASQGLDAACCTERDGSRWPLRQEGGGCGRARGGSERLTNEFWRHRRQQLCGMQRAAPPRQSRGRKLGEHGGPRAQRGGAGSRLIAHLFTAASTLQLMAQSTRGLATTFAGLPECRTLAVPGVTGPSRERRPGHERLQAVRHRRPCRVRRT